ncbi:MAG: YcxB family protein [Clostridia bacterium]|nr:YcxB family protein [Clostridia bacterium]
MDEAIRVRCQLTERQYRRYMRFHVLGDKKGVAGHLVLSALIVVFGLMNFRADSPILGYAFIALGAYFFVSRYLRFYMSVNRITEQFGLSETPKFFYALTFTGDGFDIKSDKEQARYGLDRVVRACFMEKDQIIYLYLTKSSAFLLPYAGFEQGTPGDLRARLNAARGGVVEEL